MYSLAPILSPEFDRSWPEAVALVQELASQLPRGLAVPAPQDITIEDTGALGIGFGRESKENPVTGFASLLQALLNGIDAPPALRELAAANATPAPAHLTVEGFSRALAFFERPDRAGDLRDLAGRLGAFRETAAAQQEFERLRQRVAGSEKTEAEKPARTRRVSRQHLVTAAATLGMILLGALGVRSGVTSGWQVQGVLTRVDDTLASAVLLAFDKMGVAKIPKTDSAPPPAEPQGERAVSRETTRRSGAASSGSRRAAPGARMANAPALPAFDAPSPDSGAPAVPAAPPAPRTAAPAISDDVTADPVPATAPAGTATVIPAIVYSSEDREVVPPRLLRPQLPREPRPGVDTGYFDFIIDQAGNVHEIKLISPTRRYHDFVLVAAAKAWKFKPALLNGEPVMYRMRLPIILPLPEGM